MNDSNHNSAIEIYDSTLTSLVKEGQRVIVDLHQLLFTEALERQELTPGEDGHRM